MKISKQPNKDFIRDPQGFMQKTVLNSMETLCQNTSENARTAFHSEKPIFLALDPYTIGNAKKVNGAILRHASESTSLEKPIEAYWLPFVSKFYIEGNLENIGHIEIPKKNPDCKFLFTVPMNGCSLVVTDEDKDHFTVYHEPMKDVDNFEDKKVVMRIDYDTTMGSAYTYGMGDNEVNNAFVYMYYDEKKDSWMGAVQQQEFLHYKGNREGSDRYYKNFTGKKDPEQAKAKLDVFFQGSTMTKKGKLIANQKASYVVEVNSALKPQSKQRGKEYQSGKEKWDATLEKRELEKQQKAQSSSSASTSKQGFGYEDISQSLGGSREDRYKGLGPQDLSKKAVKKKVGGKHQGFGSSSHKKPKKNYLSRLFKVFTTPKPQTKEKTKPSKEPKSGFHASKK